MGKRDRLRLILVGASLIVGCGGRTTMVGDGGETFEVGGSLATGGSPQGGTSPSYGGFSLGGYTFVFGGSTYGGWATGGYATGGRATGGTTATGGTRPLVTTGGATGGNRFAGGGSSGYGGFGASAGKAMGGYSGGGRGGTGGVIDCPVWAGCYGFVGGRGGIGGMTIRGGAGGVGGYGGTYNGGSSNGGSSAGGSLTGGTTSTIPVCVPGSSIACACTDGSLGAQVCQNSGTYAACTCLLTEMRTKIVGYWGGSRTTSWDGTHQIKMEFRKDGTYSAYCADSCTTLYWGVNEESTEKTYVINTVNSDGMGYGRIAIYFGPNNVTSGEMRDISIGPAGTTLKFSVWNGTYGPVAFVLDR